jgi:hypothetical protein
MKDPSISTATKALMLDPKLWGCSLLFFGLLLLPMLIQNSTIEHTAWSQASRLFKQRYSSYVLPVYRPQYVNKTIEGNYAVSSEYEVDTELPEKIRGRWTCVLSFDGEEWHVVKSPEVW